MKIWPWIQAFAEIFTSGLDEKEREDEHEKCELDAESSYNGNMLRWSYPYLYIKKK